MATNAQRIVVKFRSSGDAARQTPQELCELITEITQGVLVRPPGPAGRAVFNVPAKSNLTRMIEDIQKLPSVEYAEPDLTDRAQL